MERVRAVFQKLSAQSSVREHNGRQFKQLLMTNWKLEEKTVRVRLYHLFRAT